VPADLDVHLVCDNLATHKTPAIQDWLVHHPRFHLHFTPTGSSWINQVERWFGDLTDQMIRRGVHKAFRPWKPTSAPGSRTGIRTRGHSPGPRRPKRSWTHWQDIYPGFPARNTRYLRSRWWLTMPGRRYIQPTTRC